MWLLRYYDWILDFMVLMIDETQNRYYSEFYCNTKIKNEFQIVTMNLRAKAWRIIENVFIHLKIPGTISASITHKAIADFLLFISIKLTIICIVVRNGMINQNKYLPGNSNVRIKNGRNRNFNHAIIPESTLKGKKYIYHS